MPREPSIHDNDVYAYSVDCAGQRLTLHTRRMNDNPTEYIDVVFQEVLAHHFEHVLPGNILFDVEEVELAHFVRANDQLLADSWRHGWPPVEYDGNFDALVDALRAAVMRAFLVSSSYGMSGWVLARSCQRMLREGPASIS